jgi:hypothetical protein
MVGVLFILALVVFLGRPKSPSFNPPKVRSQAWR